jgi:mannose-6-phosphate isomerase-like protein (cupin superfamily)
MDVRSIADRAPRLEHEGTTTVWWMYDAREAFDETTGGHLAEVSEVEVAGGAVLRRAARSAHDYYYVLSGHGLMTIGDETREVGPGDLVSVPPATDHLLGPVSEHAPVRCLAFAVGADGDDASAVTAPGGERYRSIRDVAPVRGREPGVTVWPLVATGELAGTTAGGYLELANEWEVAGGGAVHTHAHPTVEFYYGLTGRGVMTIDGEDREVGPGDLILIPPDAPHSIRPIGDHAPIRCFCFAVGLAGSDAYDYAHDHSAVG